MGCTPSSTTHAPETNKKAESVAENSVIHSKKEISEITDRQKSSEINKVILDQNFLSQIQNNIIQGFSINIGTLKAEVIELYGPIIEEDYYTGGLYSKFQNLNDVLVFFDEKNRVFSIRLDSNYLDKTNIDEIKEVLGKPISEEIINEDETTTADDRYFFSYMIDNIYINFEADNTESPVYSLHIIKKE